MAPGARLDVRAAVLSDPLRLEGGDSGDAAARVVESARSLAEMVKEAGGRKESTIIGFGGRVPAWMAAFANGAMAHCLDYDDHLDADHHPSSALVPACLAVAERVGNVSGKDFVTAVALGQDIFIRLRWKAGVGQLPP